MPTSDSIPPHEFADRFPMMDDAEFEALVEDIRVNGQKERILLFEGKILDGRNRYRACRRLGIEAETRTFDGTREEAERLATSANLLRRHLSKSQKAMYLVRSGLVAPAPPEGSRRRYGTGRDAIMAVGKRYGVNHVTIYKAAFVDTRDPELSEQVLAGELSVGKAEALLREREQPLSHRGSRRKRRIKDLAEAEELVRAVSHQLYDLASSEVLRDHLQRLNAAKEEVQKVIDSIAEGRPSRSPRPESPNAS